MKVTLKKRESLFSKSAKSLVVQAQQSLSERTRTGICKTGCRWESGFAPQEVSWWFSSSLISANPSQEIFTGMPSKLGQNHTICAKLTGQVDLGAFPLTRGRKSPPAPWRGSEDFTSLFTIFHQNNQLLTLLPQKPMQLPCRHSHSSLSHLGEPKVLQTLAMQKSHESRSVLKSSSK